MRLCSTRQAFLGFNGAVDSLHRLCGCYPHAVLLKQINSSFLVGCVRPTQCFLNHLSEHVRIFANGVPIRPLSFCCRVIACIWHLDQYWHPVRSGRIPHKNIDNIRYIPWSGNIKPIAFASVAYSIPSSGRCTECVSNQVEILIRVLSAPCAALSQLALSADSLVVCTTPCGIPPNVGRKYFSCTIATNPFSLKSCSQFVLRLTCPAGFSAMQEYERVNTYCFLRASLGHKWAQPQIPPAFVDFAHCAKRLILVTWIIKRILRGFAWDWECAIARRTFNLGRVDMIL